MEQLAAAGNHKTYSKNDYHENIFLILILTESILYGFNENIFLILTESIL